MPIPHDLKIGDKRQTRDGNTATFVAYLPDGNDHSRLLWTVRDRSHFTTSEQGLYDSGYARGWDIPSLSVKRTYPRVGMMVRKLLPSEHDVGVIVALTCDVRVKYKDAEGDQFWTTDAEVKWPWEDEWHLVAHD